MERASIEIRPETSLYKSYSKATFNGYNRDFPTSLRQVLDPSEFDQIINEINLRTVRRKNTPVLKGTYYFGLFTFAFFIGIPIMFGCFVTHKYVYKKYYKKLRDDITTLLFQFNNTEVCKRKGVIFSLREKPKTDHFHNAYNEYSDASTTAFDYYIVVSYYRQPGQQNDNSQSNVININNNVNVLNSRRNNTSYNNNLVHNNNNNNNNKIDHSMEIPIDSPSNERNDLDKDKKWIVQ